MINATDFNLFKIDHLILVFVDLYERKNGMTKVKEIERKVTNSKRINLIAYNSISTIPTANNLLESLHSIPYFIFSSAETIGLGALIALKGCIFRANPEYLNMTDGEWHSLLVEIIFKCERWKIYTRSNFFNEYYQSILRFKKDAEKLEWDLIFDSMEDIDFNEAIISFLKPDLIDATKFFDNYNVFKSFFTYTPSSESDLMGKMSRTMKRYCTSETYPTRFPFWFVAGYPEIVYWLIDEGGLEQLATYRPFVMIIEVEQDYIKDDQFNNKALRIFVDYYKMNVKNSFECQSTNS